jgi:hypothetical protein
VTTTVRAVRRIPLAVLIATLALVGLGCSSGGSSASSASSSSSATTTTTTPPTTAAKTTTTATPPPEAPTGAATAEAAAKGLVDRWSVDDKAGAAAFATPEVIAELFTNSGAGNTWMYQGCDGVAGGAGCSFSYEGGGVTMHVRDNGVVNGTGFTVDSISYTAD